MSQVNPSRHRFSVAPMMSYTDRYNRYFHRLISRHALLYTEMVHANAIIHGDRDHHLAFDSFEKPLVLQLGGSEPGVLGRSAKIAESYGYDEVNLNIGCPSERVQKGRFGACLMSEPELVRDCVAEMSAQTRMPVTVKTRIGIDHQDSYAFLCEFIEKVTEGGCKTFVVHARKAWLQGLNPKQNREVPPLDYQRVYQLKRDYPDIEIVINGGIENVPAALVHMDHVDGVMLGRQAYHNPYLLAQVDAAFFGDASPPLSRHQVLSAYAEFVDAQLVRGVKLSTMTRHILGLFQACPGARAWRRALSQGLVAESQDASVLLEASKHVNC